MDFTNVNMITRKMFTTGALNASHLRTMPPVLLVCCLSHGSADVRIDLPK